MPTDKYQIRLLRIAEEDLAEIISFIAAENPIAANSIADKIEKNIELLSENPMLGRIPRDEDIKNLSYRYIIVQNYTVFYTIEERTIFIHRILHGARNYKTLLWTFSSITALPISGAPEQERRTIPTTFYILKILFNRTNLNKKLFTELLSQ